MCGRYALAGDWSDFVKEFGLDEVPGFPQRYNIAPSAAPGFEVPILAAGEGLRSARFWYIPSWWRGPLRELPTAFNARSETVLSKPYFKGAQACLIPTSGWREFPGPRGAKRAFNFFTTEHGQARSFFAFAGVMSAWVDPETGALISTCAILTGEPHALVRPHHHRMPLIVSPSSYAQWLADGSSLRELIAEVSESSQRMELDAYECSTFGNSTRVEGPQCIVPVPGQKSLF
jgi:putative SOS response-associated peptidase YedK